MRQYQISVDGHKFSVSSGYGEEHIRKVEEFLNKKFQELSGKSETFGPTGLAVLVSLNLADELITLKEEFSLRQSWEKNLEFMCNQLDKVIRPKELN